MKNVVWILALTLFLFSCTSKQKEAKKKEMIKKIESVEKDFMGYIGKGQLNYEKGKELENLYDSYITDYPRDTVVPKIIYNAGSIKLKYMNDINGAINFFKRLKENYPKYEQTPMAIYTLAYIYNDRKRDFDKARENYQYLIDHYPNHFLAEESKILIVNVGKTDEDLWKYIQEKNNSTK
jgi:tetratricopeptide (TPR) repeat protein